MWSSCSKTCNSGKSRRGRVVEIQPQHNGTACPVLEATKSCNDFLCPVDCKVKERRLIHGEKARPEQKLPRSAHGALGAPAQSLAAGEEVLVRAGGEELLSPNPNMEEHPAQLLMAQKVATTSLSPPEYHLEKRRDKKERHNVGDPHLSWTLGTILWDMVTGQRISFENLEDLVNFKLQIPKSIIGLENSVTHQLLKKLLEVNPAKRLKFSLLHQYLQC